MKKILTMPPIPNLQNLQKYLLTLLEVRIRRIIERNVIDDVEILAPPVPSEMDKRSMCALAMLDRCTAERAVFNTMVRGEVILTVVIRGLGTCELSIPKAKYEPWRLLDLIELHGGHVHVD